MQDTVLLVDDNPVQVATRQLVLSQAGIPVQVATSASSALALLRTPALGTQIKTVVTDHIDTFVPEGIRLKSGRVLEADIVVTATGLRLLAFGGIRPHVDGRPVELSEQFMWRGAMITGLPNFAVCIGYTNASWTLRADLSSRLV